MKRSPSSRALAALTLLSMLAGSFPKPARAQAGEGARDDHAAEPAVDPAAAPRELPADSPPRAEAPEPESLERGHRPIGEPVEPKRPAPEDPEPVEPAQAPIAEALPTGTDATGVSSQVLSLPQGAGKIQGMGESFSNQLSTGVGSYSIPIALPGARGGADPSLALAYSTGGGQGVIGLGWDLGVPFIARQTDRGGPQYLDPPAAGPWAPTQDRFVFNGGEELVPICLVQGTSCAGSLPGEAMPSWAAGWQYFRPRIEGEFLRFFWSPDHQTWRVQDKSGKSMEIGAPLDGTASTGTIELNPDAPGQIFRWNVSRLYDAYGAANPGPGVTPLPVNVTRYLYTVDGAISHLSDIYDTPPAANAATASVSTYAHHVRLVYAKRPDVISSFRRGWATRETLRLVGIDVTSAPFTGAGSSTRKLTRRYHLTYDPAVHTSLLASLQIEGRCGTPAGGEAEEPIAEDASGSLPATSGCPTLPAMTFGYSHVTPFHADGSAGTADLAGFEGFDERVITMVASPPHSVDEKYTDLFDVNADGLPDVLVTMPGSYGGKYGLYLNSVVGGRADTFSATTMGVQGVLGEDTTTISLDNPNISSGDLDGDGVIDLIHMPQVKTYSVYTPELQGGPWVWQGRAITTAAAQSPKINLGGDGVNIQRMDVNGDGLVDVVVSTGTEMETFLSLDRYPGGDGQFGHATWTSATTATISNDPLTSCVPWDGLPVALSDPTIKIADMNGDSLPDIVRMEQGNVHYWPGRGNGFWGTGAPSACPSGAFGENQAVAMTASPEYADPNGSALRIDDVNGDGLDDVVEVNFTEVNVWLNVDGGSWIGPHVIAGAPASPAYQSRVRIVDMNGSGTRDILWGDAGAYRYMDLSGGQRPWLLSHIENGLGKTTDLTFASSVALMLAAASSGSPWSTVTPSPMHVVTSMTVGDHLPMAGPAGTYVSQYSYQNPVYDGVQREFRGFASAYARTAGDTNSPSSSAQSHFLLGTCEDDEPLDGLPSACTFAGRWRDNPHEALKGLPQLVETFDDDARYLSTLHQTYRLRKLYSGLDGREVRHAYVSTTDTWLYDAWSGDGAPSPATVSDVELELAPPPFSVAEYLNSPSPVPASQSEVLSLHGSALPASPTLGRVHLQTSVAIDVNGNTYQSIDRGCVDGCAQADDVITHYIQPGEVSGDTGWLWRDIETTTLGSRDTRGRNTEQTTYDTAGSPLATLRSLIGTVALVRSRAGGGAVAPAPAGASKDGWITPVVRGYDPFGNVVSIVRPNHRRRLTTFDGDFAGLPITDTVDTGALAGTGYGSFPLTWSASYDRGLAAIKALTGVHQEETDTNYDGFGRIVEVYRPLPTTGLPGIYPSMMVDYELPTDAQATPFSRVHTATQDGSDPTVASYRESWSYIDGLGRSRVTFGEADTSAGDAPWVATDVKAYDQKGAQSQSYLASFFDQDPSTLDPRSYTPTGPYVHTQYDPFARPVRTFGLDGKLALQRNYHALAIDTSDAAQQPGGSHAGAYTTTAKDGHARVAFMLERARVGGQLQTWQTATTYLSTGEPQIITRTNLTTNASVVRWMAYDTLGRRLVNVEPDTSTPFTANASANVASIKSWRYAYNDDGDLVGTSDARGCGVNYAYDTGGRIVGEDYSPCTADHATYTPVMAGGGGYEVSYLYDVPDPDTASGVPGFTPEARWYTGALTSIHDRSGETVTEFDGRGRVTGIARRLVAPGGAMAPRWYVQLTTYDAADRAVLDQAGVDDANAPGLAVTTAVNINYTKRSLIRSVDSNHGGVLSSLVHDADGLPLQVTYDDAARTTTAFGYTARRQPLTVQTYRPPPALWSSPPATYLPAPAPGGAPDTFQLLLEDVAYTYDEVDNPTLIADKRDPAEWPAGAQPATRSISYDDLYRLTALNYQYASGASDPWVSPFAAEDQQIDSDPQRATPSPHVAFRSRIGGQTFAYDWLGNTTASTDDVGGFYDRSLGTIGNGTATAGPYQLKSAASAGGASAGSLTTAYDAAGNMTGMAVKRAGTCLPTGSTCSQQYVYSWDEVGRLARARRWDLASPGAPTTVPSGAAAADLAYLYDATDDRAVKQSSDGSGNVHYTLYPLDPLELRHTTWDSAAGDYDRSPDVEASYIFVHGVRLGRVAFGEETDPVVTGPAAHLFLELPDHLGSTSLVLDHDTSELVEASTYQAFGAAESDYRPARWNSFREDYRFTGKEEDVEVGLQFFGKRYYAPALGRWVSPDPLNVHSLGADNNAYAYVHGRALRAVDSDGLAEPAPSIPAPTADSSGVRTIVRAAAAEEVVAGEAAMTLRASAGSTMGMSVLWWGKPILNWWVKFADHLTPEQNDYRNDTRYRTPLEDSRIAWRRRLISSPPAANTNGGTQAAPAASSSDGSGGGKCYTPAEWAARLNIDRIAKMNGAALEVKGYLESLKNGEIPIQGLGNPNAPGPDWITYDPESKMVRVWDAKYRSSGSIPTKIDDETMARWRDEVADAISCMPEGDAKNAAADAFLNNRVEGKVFGGGPAAGEAPAPAPPPRLEGANIELERAGTGRGLSGGGDVRPRREADLGGRARAGGVRLRLPGPARPSLAPPHPRRVVRVDGAVGREPRGRAAGPVSGSGGGRPRDARLSAGGAPPWQRGGDLPRDPGCPTRGGERERERHLQDRHRWPLRPQGDYDAATEVPVPKPREGPVRAPVCHRLSFRHSPRRRPLTPAVLCPSKVLS